LNPPTRIALATAAAFVTAVALTYAVSGSGTASEPPANVGERAIALEVAAPSADDAAIGRPASLPVLVRPKPKRPAPSPEPETTTDEFDEFGEPIETTPVPEPVAPAPVAPAPAPTPVTPAPQPAPDPGIEFDDSG
jgi:hypothetical protein